MLSQRNPQEYFCDYHEGRSLRSTNGRYHRNSCFKSSEQLQENVYAKREWASPVFIEILNLPEILFRLIFVIIILE